MNEPIRYDAGREIIDVGPRRARRKLRWWIVILAIAALFFAAARGLSIYISALWFGSLGFSSVYWYMFRLKIELFLIFFFLTVLLVRGGFWLIERAFASLILAPRVVFINRQPVNIAPQRVLKPAAWVVSVLAGFVFGLDMRQSWRSFALYTHQVTTELADPIFHKPVGFYLFTLPVYDAVSAWLMFLSIIILIATLIYALLALTQEGLANPATAGNARATSIKTISCALAIFLALLGWRVLLARYPYLWDDHQSFSGVTYTEAHYLLPAYVAVAGALFFAAAVVVLNAFSMRRVRIAIGVLAIPLLIYIVGIIIVPAYVQNFIVKPNELERETPYINQNIAWTRRAFGVDHIEQRDFSAELSIDSANLQSNRPTLDNIRLWDWRALKDTLTQIQAIRTYYDFTDVDVDRYLISGEKRQMMLATREIDEAKLPPASRNWVNEKLIYTHGYGLTMNTANGFDSEGMPKFVLSDMPIQSTAPEIKVTRPEIYYGQKTDSDVYVRTKRMEFNYPQGEANNLTTYEGSGGIQLGGYWRRWLLAAALDDLTKLPFSDDITPESRVLIHRNIRDLVDSAAPFLIYDDDPYIVIGNDGKLYWMIDAFTESSTYPYSHHYQAGDKTVNYIRNSVKVVIDAYNGTAYFYIFDEQDPLIQTYRATFPSLFRDQSQMPADLRAHVRYPETLIKVQGEVFGLYHTQNINSFFQKEDLWSVARQVSLNEERKQQEEAIEPYFVLMQLPGEQPGLEFVEILPFTPANRNNMIGWIAGRCDGAAYGSLLLYDFPKSRLIDGPLQIEARIDQNAQLSAQFTLWNQQGSHVRRGHLLVIPIGKSLLYVEPVYLQAERSPMPELRLVVLATQDRLAFGANFDEALTSLFGEALKTANETKPEQPKTSPTPLAQNSPTPAQAGPANVQQLINQAIKEFEEYQRLTSEGKLAEAGQKLEEHKRTLEELRKATNKNP